MPRSQLSSVYNASKPGHPAPGERLAAVHKPAVGFQVAGFAADHEHLDSVRALGVVGVEQITCAQSDVGPPLGAGEVAAQIGQRLLDACTDETEDGLSGGLGRSPHVGRRRGQVVWPAGQIAGHGAEMRRRTQRLVVRLASAMRETSAERSNWISHNSGVRPCHRLVVRVCNSTAGSAPTRARSMARSLISRARTDLAAERQCPSETAEGLQVAWVVRLQPARLQRRCQQVGRLRIGPPVTPIRVLVADGGLQPDERVVHRADAFVDGQRTGEITGAHVVRGRTEVHPCPIREAQLGQRRRPFEPFGRVLVGHALFGHPGRLTRVTQCLLVVAQHMRPQVVVRQAGNQRWVRAPLERFGGPGVHDPQPRRRHPADDGLAGQRVHEGELAVGVVKRPDQPDGFG